MKEPRTKDCTLNIALELYESEEVRDSWNSRFERATYVARNIANNVTIAMYSIVKCISELMSRKQIGKFAYLMKSLGLMILISMSMFSGIILLPAD